MAVAMTLGLLGAGGCYGGHPGGGDGTPPGIDDADDTDGGPGGGDDDDDDDDDSADDGDDGDTGAPEPGGVGPSDYPAGRKIRRMTADQYAASLQVATGQTWPQFEEFAGAMGKADFAEITSHDRTLSLTFDKFAHDAALWSCRAAVDADVDAGGDVILRHAGIEASDEQDVRQNVAYLLLRFVAADVTPDAPEVDAFADLVMAPSQSDITPEVLRERWTAVCVALATHPDFVAY